MSAGPEKFYDKRPRQSGKLWCLDDWQKQRALPKEVKSSAPGAERERRKRFPIQFFENVNRCDLIKSEMVSWLRRKQKKRVEKNCKRDFPDPKPGTSRLPRSSCLLLFLFSPQQSNLYTIKRQFQLHTFHAAPNFHRAQSPFIWIKLTSFFLLETCGAFIINLISFMPRRSASLFTLPQRRPCTTKKKQ